MRQQRSPSQERARRLAKTKHAGPSRPTCRYFQDLVFQDVVRLGSPAALSAIVAPNFHSLSRIESPGQSAVVGRAWHPQPEQDRGAVSETSWWCRLCLASRSGAATAQRVALQGAVHPRWAARLIVWLSLLLVVAQRSIAPAGADRYPRQVYRGAPARSRAVRSRLSQAPKLSSEHQAD